MLQVNSVTCLLEWISLSPRVFTLYYLQILVLPGISTMDLNCENKWLWCRKRLPSSADYCCNTCLLNCIFIYICYYYILLNFLSIHIYILKYTFKSNHLSLCNFRSPIFGAKEIVNIKLVFSSFQDASVQPSLVIVYFGGNDSMGPHSSGLGPHVPLPEYVENMRKIAIHLKVPNLVYLCFKYTSIVDLNENCYVIHWKRYIATLAT